MKILFFINDFKTAFWGAELRQFNYEVAEREHRFFSHIKIILTGYFKKEKIDAFIFRYLNDHKSLVESTLYFFRDLLIICLCKILRVKILWILHNIDRETQQNYPFLSQARRKLIHLASKKILVTDSNLVEVAQKYGISETKIDWLCFGKPTKETPNHKNIELRKKITAFRQRLNNYGSTVWLGLCVSESSQKKLHYLMADSVVGVPADFDNSVVGLVLIGKFPEGPNFDLAKRRVKGSPYILFIDDSFMVNEPFISDTIDFFYRSLSDQSVPYTLYIAASLKKPIVTHNFGALPLLINREGLGFVLEKNKKDFPSQIVDNIVSWSPTGAEPFLKNRSWKIGAIQLKKAIEE